MSTPACQASPVVVHVPRVIDAHHHVLVPEARCYGWLVGPYAGLADRRYGFEELRPHLRAVGVEATVVVQTEASLAETEWLLGLAETVPEAAGVVGWADLTSPELEETIARLRAGPGGKRLVGLRHLVQDEADPAWLTRPAVQRGLRRVAASGLAYDLLVRPHQLEGALAAARDLPELRCVLDHLGKPAVGRGVETTWADGIAGLARCPNVTVKLSGLATEVREGPVDAAAFRPYVSWVIEQFGPERVMLGSDWPVCELAAPYEEVWGATQAAVGDLAPAEREWLHWRTATAAYRLTARGRLSAGPA